MATEIFRVQDHINDFPIAQNVKTKQALWETKDAQVSYFLDYSQGNFSIKGYSLIDVRTYSHCSVPLSFLHHT